MQEPCGEVDGGLVPWLQSSEILGLRPALGFEETAWHLTEEQGAEVQGNGTRDRSG